MDKKICFVVPTYSGHFLYAVDFMKSFLEYHYDEQADLYFVFTTPEERNGFLPCNSIVLPKSLRIMKNRGIINIKKFYALMQLKDKYEYIIVIDDESLFCKAVNLYDICQGYFERKILYGNFVENAPWDFINIVTESCKRFFDKETQKNLYCPLWLWFNQIPIYRTADLKNFFKVTKLGKKIHDLTYNDFDYYIYMLYLIAKCNFQVEALSIVSNVAAVEVTPECSFKIVGDYNQKYIYMATCFAKEQLHFQNIILICHRDRDITELRSQNKLAKLLSAFKTYLKIKKTLS